MWLKSMKKDNYSAVFHAYNFSILDLAQLDIHRKFIVDRYMDR